MAASQRTAPSQSLGVTAALILGVGFSFGIGGCSSIDEGGDQFASGSSATATVGPTSGSSSTGAETQGSTVFGSTSAGTDTATSTSTGSGTGATESGSGSGESTSTGTGVDPCNGLCDAAIQICVEGACAEPLAPAAGMVVITEFLPDPVAVADDVGEWLELVNVGAVAVDIAGCRLTDAGATNDDHLIAAVSLILAPGATVLLAKSADGLTNGGLPAVAYAFGTTFSLTNTEDEIVLMCSDIIIDEVAYDATWPFSAGQAANLDPREQDATANDAAVTWCGASAPYGSGDLGTPGTANDAC